MILQMKAVISLMSDEGKDDWLKLVKQFSEEEGIDHMTGEPKPAGD